MRKKINIAIDGHSSCGKSTIAKAISKKYQMRYIDTGSMCRALTLYCINNKIMLNDKVNIDLLLLSLSKIDVHFNYNFDTEECQTYLNGDNVESQIRGIEVSERVSLIAEIKEVREKLIKLQKQIGKGSNIVMDGRDIGTKVFPFAEIKFFVTASAELRAKRRHHQLIKKNSDITYPQVLENLKKRDSHDSNRLINPLKMAEDAILVDTSDFTIEQQNQFIFNYIDQFLSDEN